MSRRKFLIDIFKIATISSMYSTKSFAFGLFSTSFWKRRAATTVWLAESNSMSYFGGGGLDDSPIGIGARVSRMGDGSIGFFSGLAGNSSQINAYVTSAGNGAFNINGQFQPPAAYTDTVGDQLQVECAKSTVSNQYYCVWSSGNSSYGLQACKVSSTAPNTAIATSYLIGGQTAGAYPSSGPIVCAVNSSDQLLISYYYPSALRWSLLTSSLGVTSSKNTNAGIPISAAPFASFSIGTDFFIACASTNSDNLYIVKINSSGTFVSSTTFPLSNSLAPIAYNRGEALYISATSVALVWRSKTGLAVFANYNPSTTTFNTSATDLGFSNQSITAVVAAINSSSQIVVNYGKYFKMVNTAGAMVKPLIQVASVRGGSGGIAFRTDNSRLVLVETINVSPEKSGMYARELIVS